VMGEPRRGRKLVLAGDTVPCEMTRLVAYEADLLVHEATLLEDEAERARETRHSTALGAAELAAAAHVTMLALTHVSPRYGGRELKEEARAAFENTVVPRDFDRIELPFPERGEPVHVKASEHPPERVETAAPDPVP
jgi:ribonuclease Z